MSEIKEFLLKVMINDHIVSRRLRFSDDAGYERCLAEALRDIELEMLTQKEKLLR